MALKCMQTHPINVRSGTTCMSVIISIFLFFLFCQVVAYHFHFSQNQLHCFSGCLSSFTNYDMRNKIKTFVHYLKQFNWFHFSCDNFCFINSRTCKQTDKNCMTGIIFALLIHCYIVSFKSRPLSLS